MPLISEPRIAQALRKRFEIAGPGVIETLAPELVPVVVVETLEQPELSRRAAAGGSTGPTAAQTSKAQIINRADSGKVVELISVLITLSGDADLQIRHVDDDTTLSTLNQEFFADRRVAGFPSCQVRHETSVAAAIGSAWGAFRLQSTRIHTFDLSGHVLMPGDGIVIHSDTVNTQLYHWWEWIERDPGQTEDVS